MSEVQAKGSSLRGGIKKTKHSRAPRRPVQFWAPLNKWWREYFAETGVRPVTKQVQQWFEHHGDSVWEQLDKPSWKETRIHAKCLRSTEQVKNYFREYRARNKVASEEDNPSSSLVKVKAEPILQDDDKLGRSIAKHNARVARLGSQAAAGRCDGGGDSSLTEGDESSDGSGPRRQDSSAEMSFPNKPPKVSPFRVDSFPGIAGVSMLPSSSSFPAALVTTGGRGGGRTSSSTTMSWPPVLGEAADIPFSELSRCFSGVDATAIDRSRSFMAGGPSRQQSLCGSLFQHPGDNKRRLTEEDVRNFPYSDPLPPLASVHSLPESRLQHRPQVGPGLIPDALGSTWATRFDSRSQSAAALQHPGVLQLGRDRSASSYFPHGGFAESRSGSLPSDRLPDFRAFASSMKPAGQLQLGGGLREGGDWARYEAIANGQGGMGCSSAYSSKLARCSFGGDPSQEFRHPTATMPQQDWRQRSCTTSGTAAAMKARLTRPFSERGTQPTKGIATGIPVIVEDSRNYAHRQMEAFQSGSMQQHCYSLHADPLPLPPPLCFNRDIGGSFTLRPEGNRARSSPQDSILDNLDIPRLAPQLQRLHVNSSNGSTPSGSIMNFPMAHIKQENEVQVPQKPEEHLLQLQEVQQQGMAGSWLQQVWLKEEPDVVFGSMGATLYSTPEPRVCREISSSGGLLIQVPAPLSSDSATTSCPSEEARSPHTLGCRHPQQSLQRHPSVHNVGPSDGDAARVQGLPDVCHEDPVGIPYMPNMEWEQHEEEALMTTDSWLLGDLLEAGEVHMH